MATGPIYRVPLKRRRSGRTNYYRRRGLLKSGELRLVIRRSNNNITIQFVESKIDGDITKAAVISRNLKKYGWNITGGNIPASYLTGYLAGKIAGSKGINYAILDLGLQVSQAGSKIYAALKGVTDAGVEIPASEEIFPSEDIIKGAHIAKYSENLKKEDKKKYEHMYAGYLAAKQNPEDLEKHFEKTIKAIDKEF